MKFTPSHEWISLHDSIGTVGITYYAVNELGEIVYLELPKIGMKVKAGDEVAVLESTKAAADIYTPVSGVIVAVNDRLSQNLEKLHLSPESEGWLFKIELQDPKELDKLLDKPSYEKLIQ